MREGDIERRLINVEERADNKALVMKAAKEAVTAVALKYGMSPTDAGHADRAIEEMLVNYQSTGKLEIIHDLTNMAYDAAEDIFRTLGHAEDDVMKDFLNEMNKELGHPDVA